MSSFKEYFHDGKWMQMTGTYILFVGRSFRTTNVLHVGRFESVRAEAIDCGDRPGEKGSQRCEGVVV